MIDDNHDNYCHVPGKWGLQQKAPGQTHEQHGAEKL